jgi:hypothetical protein
MNNCCAIKELSPSQMEEFKEGSRIKKMLSLTAVFSVLCGIIFTFTGLRLIKYMAGVDSFGLHLWAWLGIHFVIFWVGLIMSIVLIAAIVFAIVMVARLFRVT